MNWTPEKIKALRERLGYTQSEFAQKLGYSRYQTVLEFESGKRKPPVTVQRLLDMLDTQPSKRQE